MLHHCFNNIFYLKSAFTLAEVLLPHPNCQRKHAFTLAEFFSPYPTCQRKHAFTLAEVLITLGIIGVVAALTMPTLIANHKEKERVVQLKKAYSVIQQAFNSAIDKYGTPDNWEITIDKTGRENLANIFSEFLIVGKNCGTKMNENCFTSNTIRKINGDDLGKYDNRNDLGKIKLSNGQSIAFGPISDDCSNGTSNDICAWFIIDINGNALPNQMGVDVFEFNITKQKIIPYGTPMDEGLGKNSFYSDCLNKDGVGHACTAWVIYNENMDYLHCNDLDWNRKTSCK